MKRPELLIENGELAGKRFEVTEKGLRLGRSSSNDVHIPDEELSRNHCFFEVFGDAGIRITDLASANGTTVNGRIIGGDAVELKPGDTIEVGKVVIRVVGEQPPKSADAKTPVAGGPVDLGFGKSGRGRIAASKSGAEKPSRSPLANLLWGVVALVFVVGIAVVLLVGDGKRAPQEISAAEPGESLCELSYEKVDADSSKVFRYSMALVNGTTLTASVDDIADEDRHLVKSAYLNDATKARLEELVAEAGLEQLDDEYCGPESEPPVLNSRALSVVWTRHAKRVRCVNTVEPEAFARLRERLEAFTKNELGIWAMGYSRSQLVALAEESHLAAREKWEDRNVEYGNCHAAVRVWKEALFYLETVNPKPPQFEEYRKGLKAAEEKLDETYREHRFAADRAINIADWPKAREELQVLMALVPDRDDDRYREASTKLVDVEKRMNGKK